MLDSGVHFGHKARFWHPKMAPYIYGVRGNIHIINLEKTLVMFSDALNFAGKLIREGGNILFVGTKRAANEIIKKEAIRCAMPYVNHRWLGGMLTNYKTIKSSIKRLKDLEYLSEENFAHVNKKEGLLMSRELEKLERNLGGIKDIEKMPDALFVIDVGYERIAVKEAQKLNIPIIGVVDTNYNPENIDYIIPGNDDSIHSIAFYVRELTNTVLEAKAIILQAEPSKKITMITDKKDKPLVKSESKNDASAKKANLKITPAQK